MRPTVTWDAVPDAVAYQVWLTNRTTGVWDRLPRGNGAGQPRGAPPKDLTPVTTSRSGCGRCSPTATAPRARPGFSEVAEQDPVRAGGPVATPSPAFNWTTVDGATRYVLVLTDLTNQEASCGGSGRRTRTGRRQRRWSNGHPGRWTVAARNESGFGLFATALDFRVTL